MAKRGDAAREAVKNKIIEAFGDSFVAFLDKKIYVEAQDGPGGENIQFSITMTMPKTPVERAGATSVASTGEAPVAPSLPTPVELTPEDKQKVAELMNKLGVTPSGT